MSVTHALEMASQPPAVTASHGKRYGSNSARKLPFLSLPSNPGLVVVLVPFGVATIKYMKKMWILRKYVREI
jgi:hypothetical protein